MITLPAREAVAFPLDGDYTDILLPRKQSGKTIFCACWSRNVRRGGCDERGGIGMITSGRGGVVRLVLDGRFVREDLLSAACEDVALSCYTRQMEQ